MSFDVQTTMQNRDSSVQRLPGCLNIGKAIETGHDQAHKPLRLIAFKKQPLGQVSKIQCASTSKCAGPKLTVTNRPNQPGLTIANISIKEDKGCVAFCADHSKPSSGSKIDNGAPTICHDLSIRLAQRFSYSESSVFEVGERLGAILHRVGRSSGCTLGGLQGERSRSRPPSERDEYTQGEDISLFRAVVFLVDDLRTSACHCVHRGGAEHNRVLTNQMGSV